jgi:hypothetical protein
VREQDYRDWLEDGGAHARSAQNTRVFALTTIENNLPALGLAATSLEQAWADDRFEALRERLQGMREDAKRGGVQYRLLMPASENPHNRLTSWKNWLVQYGRFLSGERQEHKDADKIRRYVLEAYVEAGREGAEATVDVRVRDVNQALNLNDAWPNICQTLAGKKFQDLADVPPPQRLGVNMSTTTVFRIDLDPADYWADRTLRERYGEPIARSKKMVAYALGDGRQIALDLESSAPQLWLEGTMSFENATVRHYAVKAPRHSNLPARLRHVGADAREVSLVTVPNAEVLQTILTVYEGEAADFASRLELLRARFLKHCPEFRTFEEPGDTWVKGERDYKVAAAMKVQAALDENGSDLELGQQVFEILKTAASAGPLVRWQTEDAIAKRHPEALVKFYETIGRLVRSPDGAEDSLSEAFSVFARLRQEGVAPLTFGEQVNILFSALSMVSPGEAAPLKISMANKAAMALGGEMLFRDRFELDDYRRFRELFSRIYAIMRDEWDWKPADLFDVQGFLWVALKYSKPESANDPQIWIVTARWGDEDGFSRFIERQEWSLLYDGATRFNDRVRAVQPGDVIVMRDYFHQVHDLPFHANGKRVSAIRLRAIGTVTEQRDDGISVGVDWAPLEHQRTWYFYTKNDPIWRLVDKGESPSAAALRRFIIDGEDQDFDWFINDPYWHDRLFGHALPEAQKIMKPTNLILYGPPGTGKTYRTALEAVRLCDGAADYPDDEEGRAALMARYEELAKARQIEFVTFHQNFSYEDFIEGLRPVPLESDEGASAGFQLQAEAGIFRRIAEQADKPVVRTDQAFSLEGREIFKLSLGQSNQSQWDWVYDQSLEEGYAYLGFKDVDWSDRRFEKRDAILAELRSRFPEEDMTAQMGPVKSPDRFRNQLSIGDVVIVSKGLNAFRAIGVVEGDYEYAHREGGRYCHRRKVRWLWDDPEGVPVGEINEKRFSLDTIYPLPKSRLNLATIERYTNSGRDEEELGGERLPHVLIIDEINRANISKVFGELITLIEPDKRLGQPNGLTVRLPYSKRQFGVPSNLHIVGTMNTADRSIALLDTALRRRFRFEEMEPDCGVPAFQEAEAATGLPLTHVLTTMNRRIEYLVDRDHRIGQTFFIGCTNRSEVDAVMRDKIIPLLQEYFFDDWNRLAAVLGEKKGQGGAFLACEMIEDPTSEGGEPLSSWRVLPNFPRDAYEQLIGRLPDSGSVIPTSGTDIVDASDQVA